jgi:Ca2+-binding RTX toxin-like protein
MLARTGLAVIAATTLAVMPLPLLTAAHADAVTCAGLTATVVGTAGDDDLQGTDGVDVVSMGVGNDRFSGLGGDDVVCGGPGDDSLYGGEGNDSLYGEDGNDHLAGQDGNDTVVTGGGRNSVVEGLGDDTLRGGTGIDLLDYRIPSSHGTAGVVIDTAAGTASGYGSDTLRGFDQFRLTGHDDTFRGRGTAELVDAYGGSDTIWTAGGNDRIGVGIGSHVINTGTGDDKVDGWGSRGTRISLNAGDDQARLMYAGVISGGDGNDTLETYRPRSRLVGGPGSDTVIGVGNRDSNTGVDIDLVRQRVHSLTTLSEVWYLNTIENATGTPYDDLLFGDSGPNILKGLGGNDYINGRGGDDSISGGDGDDTIIR